MREVFLKNLNANIYIDSADVIDEKDFDGKIRVYDSRKEYLDYYEYENFFLFEKETFEQVYEKEISYLENIKTIYELLGTFGIRALVRKSDNLKDIELQYIDDEYFAKQDAQGRKHILEQNEFINIVGEYWIYTY